MNELKPCPFCGSEDIYYYSDGIRSFFSCWDCKTDGPVIAYQDEQITYFDLMEKTREMWNKRI